MKDLRSTVPVLFAAWILCSGAYAHATPGTTPASDSTPSIDASADAAFAEIQSIFASSDAATCKDNPKGGKDSCNYWILGHAFDTVLDYLAYKNDKQLAQHFADVALNAYNTTLDPSNVNAPACWYDDFGWWAVATQRASADPKLRALWTQSQQAQFDLMARNTWSYIQGATQVWEMCEVSSSCMQDFNQPGSSQKPLHTGGVWNYFWAKKKLAGVCNTPSDPTDPTNSLAGRQNTVTNTLFFVAASLRAHQFLLNPYFNQAATRQLGFMWKWRDAPSGPADSLFKDVDQGRGQLIRERVGSYADGHPDKWYRPDLIWAADQGMLMGGLITLRDGVPDYTDDSNLGEEAVKIADGVLAYLVMGDHRFLPWSNSEHPKNDQDVGRPPGTPAYWDYEDYNTGIAALMRYLLYIYKIDPAMQDYLKVAGYPTKIKAFAKDLAADPEAKDACYLGPPSEYRSCSELVHSANALGVYVDALEMSR